VFTHYLAAGYGNVNIMGPNPKDIKLSSWLADLLKRITGEEFRDIFDLRDFILSKASTGTRNLPPEGSLYRDLPRQISPDCHQEI
jgi:hypothetical protein